MFAFGCSVIDPELYERYARPGIERAAEPDSKLLVHAAASSIARGYNVMFDHASKIEDLEALVLLHADAEIVDPDFSTKLRRVLQDPAVGIVGSIGAVGVRDIAWWDGSLKWSSAPYHFGDHGGGELLWSRNGSGPEGSPGDVDAVYGVLLAVSPWVVRNLRFDESLGLLHGYDFDICAQARAAGRKVVAADLEVAHHHSLDLVKQIEMWVATHARVAEAWDERGPADGEDEEAYWKARARRAEAEAAAARLLAASKLLWADATSSYQQRLIAEKLESRSWRVTEPLRRGKAVARIARQRVRTAEARVQRRRLGVQRT